MNYSVNSRFSRLVSFPLFLVLFFVLGSTTLVGQNNTSKVNYTNVYSDGNDDKESSKKASISEENNFNFVSWFMGTKESIKEERLDSDSSSTKKMLINARIAPNRLLMKAFLKKTQNQNSTLA